MVKQSKVQQILDGASEEGKKRRMMRRESRESLETVHFEAGEEVREYLVSITRWWFLKVEFLERLRALGVGHFGLFLFCFILW